MDIPERVSVAVCAFCRRAQPEVTFVSEEHIVPESIGNTDNRLIIPPGTVCDPCNHEELANLDRILLDFLPIKLTRVIGRIPNKSGAYPSLSSANSVTIKGGADTVHLNLPNRRFGKITTNDAGVEITFSVQDAKMTDARKVLLARALFKIVFECMVHKYGVTWALLPQNDIFRDLILRGHPPSHGFIAIKMLKSHDVCFQVQWQEGVPFSVRLHNVQFHFSLLDDINGADEFMTDAQKHNLRVLYW